jgi:hypothetical protein
MVVAFIPFCCMAAEEEGFVSLFDGKTLDGWKAAENPGAFKVEDGAIVVNGTRGHLFYAGDVQNHDFKNFDFKADVKTTPGSNSGLYFHTKYQESGWPKAGFEAQVNTSHTDPKRTGSLYGIVDVKEAPAKDDEWFTEEIIVRGKQIVIKVDGKTLVDYTEPSNLPPPEGPFARRLASGTFAIQAHDPKSKVFVKNIRVKPLPD